MKKECSEFEILISAAIDGELQPAEFAELESHVDHCGNCRRQYQTFETVNDWLIAHDAAESENGSEIAAVENKRLVETSARSMFESVLPANGHSHSSASPLAQLKNLPTTEDNSNRGRTFLAGGFLAATAAGLAALLTTGPGQTASAPLRVTDISVPAEKVSLLNEQSHSIQASQAKAIEQELRTLKLMVQHCNGSKAEIDLIESKIDSLTERVQKLNEKSLNP